jgi:hypothetical protein
MISCNKISEDLLFYTYIQRLTAGWQMNDEMEGIRKEVVVA